MLSTLKLKIFLLSVTMGLWIYNSQAVVFSYNPSSCEQEMYEAEEAYSFPRGLLNAIGIVESAKKDTYQPWPWAIGTLKRGYHPNSKAEAILLVKRLQSQGIKNIDVGCMQINLKAHPKAFENLEEAFDPRKNIAYAAQFIHSLKTRRNVWQDVIGLYHSKKQEYYVPYKNRVYLTWHAYLKRQSAQRTFSFRTKLYKPTDVFRGTQNLPEGLELTSAQFRALQKRS